MKLGVLVSLSEAEALERKFADLKKYGFESCQLCSKPPKKPHRIEISVISAFCLRRILYMIIMRVSDIVLYFQKEF